jgi:hypothetical protein
MNIVERKLAMGIVLGDVHALWIYAKEHPELIEHLNKYVDAGLLTCETGDDGLREYRNVRVENAVTR